MAHHWLDRTTLLIGKEQRQRLQATRVLIVGLGGVGGFAAEFLARAGVGHMTIVDGDEVDVTNKNRQVIALNSTIGQPKAELVRARLEDINPDMEVEAINQFLEPDMMLELVGKGFDYVLDCIDSIQPKFHLILACKRHNTRFISAMGAGGKMDVSKVKVMNIWHTENDRLALQIKKLLKKKKALRKFKVVCSTEPIREDALEYTDGTKYKKTYYGTISYMPAIFGLYMAEWVIRKIVD
ncbi:MAG TPA: tRNA threonylcarbamoyladenosine dehydratase [Saprospiraceae bacterium]|nr:tRNA threonylcarbamoyladenosine dehydratase [Saprospiraceae bacterium]